jgi:O-antigen/teichoic acid export membrane protein
MLDRSDTNSLDHSLARAVAWNAFSRWISQVLSWASTIYVARLLTPYDYGIIGMAGLYLNFALYVGNAGISDSIIALRNLTSRQIAELNSVALAIATGLVIFSCGLARPVSLFFSAPPLYGVILVSSLTFVFSAFQVVPRALLQRELRFKFIAGTDIVRTLVQMATTIVCARLKFGFWSIVIGNLAGILVITVIVLWYKWQSFGVPHIKGLQRELIYSWHSLLSRLTYYVYENADFAVAGKVLGEIPLGNYSVAWNISSAPVEKIANLVTGVTPAYFSALQADPAELRRYLLKLTEMLSFITVPASVGLALSADYIVMALLGPKWIGAIGPLRILGLFVAARSITTFLPNLLTAIGDAAFVMKTAIGSSIVMFLAFYIGSKWGTSGIAASWLFAYPIIVAPVYARVFRKTQMHPKIYLSVISPSIVSTGLMAIAVLAIRQVLSTSLSPLAHLLFIVIGGMVFYIAALLVFYRRKVGGYLQIIPRLIERN